ncbi:uncharacterized protein LOC142612453 [Castanea sativa]|uniref:uncharacterized protein LOC142612453 n=1 Tax=Castanea sativa TaxID=21020 RepID=UPI003F64FCCA
MAEVNQEREESVGSQKGNPAITMQRGDGKQHTPSVVVESYQIDYLRKRLERRKRGRRSPSYSFNDSSEEKRGGNDHQASKSLPSESRLITSSGGRAKRREETRGEDGSYQGEGNDAMGKALRQISKSPFVAQINKAKLPHRFSQPIFTIYNGRTDPVEHFGTSGHAMFDVLEEGSLKSFEELTRAFGAWFITCSKVPKPLDALLFMAMREGETLKTYSDRYWEMYNEIDGDVENVAVRTFKVGLPTEHGLRKSLTMKAAVDMRQLMDRIDKYKWVEEDQIQSKGIAKLFPEKKDLRGMGYQGSRPRRDFSSCPLPAGTPLVNSLFKESIHQILEKIRDEPYFGQPNKMSGDASLRNQSLHYHYHQDKGHTTEECRTLRDHLNQLAKAGKHNHFLSRPDGQVGHQGTRMYRGNIPRLALGTINVILA